MQSHYLQSALLILFSTITFTVNAASLATVTLDNGATILLHDDNTWEYIAINSKTVNSVTNKHTSAVETSTVLTTTDPTQVKSNKSSLIQAGLLNTAVKNDVKVTFNDAIWKDQSLGLTFTLSSKNPDGVVIVKVNVTFYDNQTNQIAEKTLNVWQASYRLPETYLRKGDTRDSRVIWVEGINKAQWTNNLLSLKIIEVETR